MQKKNGFTLIELLTVVMILGILTAFALPQYRKATERANAANALINVRSLFDAAKRYHATRGTWPTSFTGLDVTLLLNPGSTNRSGEFEYTFDATNKVVSACRLKGDDPDNAYCLQAYYKKNGQRDVFLCAYLAAKYQAVCEAMGDCPSDDNECTLK